MKRTLHFSSVVGRDIVFDPSQSQDLAKLHGKFSTPGDEAKLKAGIDAALDVESGYKLMGRNSPCPVNMRKEVARDPLPLLAVAERQRRERLKRRKKINAALAHAMMKGENNPTDMSQYYYRGRRNVVKDQEEEEDETYFFDNDRMSPDQLATEKSPTQQPSLLLPSVEFLSKTFHSPRISFPKALRGMESAIEQRRQAQEEVNRALLASGAIGAITPVPTTLRLAKVAKSKKETEWAKTPGRSGRCPNRLAEEKLQELQKQKELRRAEERAKTEAEQQSYMAEADAAFAAAGVRVSQESPETQLISVIQQVNEKRQLAGTEKTLLGKHDIYQVIEKNRVLTGGHARDGKGFEFARGPLFRLDTGRDLPVAGIAQPGVAGTKAKQVKRSPEDDEHDPSAAGKHSAVLREQLEKEIAAEMKYPHRGKQYLERHVPRTSLMVSGRVHPLEKQKQQLFAHVSNVLAPENLQKVLNSNVRMHDEMVARIRKKRELREARRERGDEDEEHSEPSRASSREGTSSRPNSRSSSAKREREILRRANFLRNLNPRTDDFDNKPLPKPSMRIRCRDFFQYAPRFEGDISELVAPLPHLDRAVEQIDRENDRLAKTIHKKMDIHVVDDADDIVFSGMPNTINGVELPGLPLLGEFLGVTKEKLLKADKEKKKSMSKGPIVSFFDSEKNHAECDEAEDHVEEHLLTTISADDSEENRFRKKTKKSNLVKELHEALEKVASTEA